MRRWATLASAVWVTLGTVGPSQADAEAASPNVAELSADSLHAGTVAFSRFENYVRHEIPDNDKLADHLRDPSNYLVAIDDRSDYFSVAFIPVGHPALEMRRGGGWECLIGRVEWRVIGCHRMK